MKPAGRFIPSFFSFFHDHHNGRRSRRAMSDVVIASRKMRNRIKVASSIGDGGRRRSSEGFETANGRGTSSACRLKNRGRCSFNSSYRGLPTSSLARLRRGDWISTIRCDEAWQRSSLHDRIASSRGWSSELCASYGARGGLWRKKYRFRQDTTHSRRGLTISEPSSPATASWNCRE